MKKISDYIIEALKIKSGKKVQTHKYFPEDKEELVRIIKREINEQGNSADLNNIDTSKITDMSKLFSKHFKEFSGNIDGWDVSNVTNFNEMFKGCKNLTSLNLSRWKISEKCKNMSSMFGFCNNIKTLGDISDWDVSNVKFLDGMFENCRNLEMDITKWKFNKRAYISLFNDGADGVKVDLTNI